MRLIESMPIDYMGFGGVCVSLFLLFFKNFSLELLTKDPFEKIFWKI